MKKTIKIGFLVMLLAFLLTGCGKQVNITDTFSASDNSESLLETFAAYTYKNAENPATLEFSKVEIMTQNSFAGELAMIYNKAYDESIINARVADYYKENSASYKKNLIKGYKSIVKSLNSRISKIQNIDSSASTENLKAYVTVLEDYIKELQNGAFSLDEVITKANELLNGLSSAITADFSSIKATGDLKAQITSIERIKNVDMQKIYNGQEIIKQELIEKEQKEFEKLVTKEVKDDYEAMVKNSNSSVKIKSVQSNKTEIFVVIGFKEISEIYKNVYVAQAKTVYEDDSVSAELFRDVSKTKVKYLVDNLESSEIKAIDDYVSDIKYRVESLNTIKLELAGQNIIKKYNTQFTNEMNAYSKEMMAINSSSVTNIDNTPITDIPQLEESIADEAEVKIRDLNLKTKEKLDAMVGSLISEMESYRDSQKAIDDSKAVEKALKVINNYYDKVVKYESSSLTSDECYKNFGENVLTYFMFSKPFDKEIRITVEGKCLFKYKSGKTIDDNDNFTINAKSSGDNAIRISPGSEQSLFLSTPKAIGKFDIMVVFIIYLVALVVMFIFKRKWAIKTLAVTLLLTITLIVIYPLAFVLGSSFNESTSLASVGTNPIPKKITLVQYERLFINTDYAKWYVNSFKIAIANMILTCTLAVSSAYVYSRFRFKGKKAGLMAMLIIQIFPSFSTMVATYTLLSSITMFEGITKTASLVNTHLGLILVYVAGQIPYNTWLVKGYFDTIPKSLDEAARIDGASNLRTFYEIILPLGMPMVSFVAVTSFMAPWMDYIMPRMLLTASEKKTLAIGLFEMVSNQKSANQYTMFAAGAILVAVPITLLFSYFQKYIVQGLSAGAVKE